MTVDEVKEAAELVKRVAVLDEWAALLQKHRNIIPAQNRMPLARLMLSFGSEDGEHEVGADVPLLALRPDTLLTLLGELLGDDRQRLLDLGVR